MAPASERALVRASVKRARPCVTALCSLSWDGRTTAPGGSLPLSPAMAQFVVQILAGADAVVEGAISGGAAFMDAGWLEEPLRAARLARNQSACPLRVFLSGHGSFEPRWMKGEASARRVVCSAKKLPAHVLAALEGVAEVRVGAGEGIQPEEVLRSLSEESGVRSLVVDGGGGFFLSLLQAGCVDELCLALEPRLFGNKGGETLTGVPGDFLPASVKASLVKMEEVAGECFTRWKLRHQRELAEKIDAFHLMT